MHESFILWGNVGKAYVVSHFFFKLNRERINFLSRNGHVFSSNPLKYPPAFPLFSAQWWKSSILLSEEASPHIKQSTVSWQLPHYSILLAASGLIIMVFNLKHGECPAWLPRRRCVVLRLGFKQEKRSPRSPMQLPFIECQQLKKKNNTEGAGPRRDFKWSSLHTTGDLDTNPPELGAN